MTTFYRPSELTAGFYSMAEAAKRLGVSPRTAAEWVLKGCFPVQVTTINGRRRVAVAVLERYLSQGWL